MVYFLLIALIVYLSAQNRNWKQKVRALTPTHSRGEVLNHVQLRLEAEKETPAALDHVKLADGEYLGTLRFKFGETGLIAGDDGRDYIIADIAPCGPDEMQLLYGRLIFQKYYLVAKNGDEYVAAGRVRNKVPMKKLGLS